MNDDFVSSSNQNYQLPNDYQWIRTGKWWLATNIIVTAMADMAAWILFRMIKRPKIVFAEKIRNYHDAGFFVYGNHTQTHLDALMAFHLLPRRFVNIIASPANLGVSIIGRMLPLAGVLPIPSSFHKLREFTQAVNQQARDGHAVFIYPEAHVWPFYTKIRPFSRSAFHYPVDTSLASFCLTTTYQARRWSKKPKIVIYVDGPFYPRQGLDKRQQELDLKQQIVDCMTSRSSLNDIEYIHYKKVK